MLAAPREDDAPSHPFLGDSLGEDEYRQIISFCGTHVLALRAVSRLFYHLWSDPATWANLSVALYPPAAPEALEWYIDHVCHNVFPLLSQAAAVDTHALALRACGGRKVLHYRLSQARFELLPAVGALRPPVRGWYRPGGGFCGVSSNASVDGSVARRANPEIPGMAAVCGDGPVLRDAEGTRSFALQVEGLALDGSGGIYVGFTATAPDDIDFSDAQSLWSSTTMWRLVGDDLDSNVPSVCMAGVKPGMKLTAQTNQPRGATAAPRWTTEALQLGDELRLTAQRTGRLDGEMCLSATLNGAPVVLPTLMVRCSFAMELWPYVAVCGRVTAVRLLRS